MRLGFEPLDNFFMIFMQPNFKFQELNSGKGLQKVNMYKQYNVMQKEYLSVFQFEESRWWRKNYFFEIFIKFQTKKFENLFFWKNDIIKSA